MATELSEVDRSLAVLKTSLSWIFNHVPYKLYNFSNCEKDNKSVDFFQSSN